MNNFWQLVIFEFKKMLLKRSTWIGFVLFILTIVFSCFGTLIGSEYVAGDPIRSNYDSMKIDRAYERALSGRKINSDLIMEASEAYQKVPVEKSIQYTDTPEYQTYARPYSFIYNIIRTIYNKTVISNFGYQAFEKITPDIASSFYDYRIEKILDTTENYPINDNVKEKIIALDKQVVKPFTFEYFGGYDRFLVLMYTNGMISAFLVAFMLTPIFCGEYHGSDQMILSTKNGKKSLIKAKLFAGFSVCTAVAIVGTLLTYLPCMLLYGFDGANAMIQLEIPLCTLPLTIGQISIICFVCVLFACILLGAITMLLSSKVKSSIVVITISGALIFIPIFIRCSNNILPLYKLYLLLPSNMMVYNNMIDPTYYDIFGLLLQPYIVMPTFALFVSMILMPFTYKSFKNHQVE